MNAVLAAVVGALLTFTGGVLYRLWEALTSWRQKRKAERAALQVISEVLRRVDERASDEGHELKGMFYKRQLGTEILRLARNSSGVLDGASLVDLIVVGSALRVLSFDHSQEDSRYYCIDELIADICLTQKRLVSTAYWWPAKRRRELRLLDERVQLMHNGVGAFQRVAEDSPPPNRAV